MGNACSDTADDNIKAVSVLDDAAVTSDFTDKVVTLSYAETMEAGLDDGDDENTVMVSEKERRPPPEDYHGNVPRERAELVRVLSGIGEYHQTFDALEDPSPSPDQQEAAAVPSGGPAEGGKPDAEAVEDQAAKQDEAPGPAMRRQPSQDPQKKAIKQRASSRDGKRARKSSNSSPAKAGEERRGSKGESTLSFMSNSTCATATSSDPAAAENSLKAEEAEDASRKGSRENSDPRKGSKDRENSDPRNGSKDRENTDTSAVLAAIDETAAVNLAYCEEDEDVKPLRRVRSEAKTLTDAEAEAKRKARRAFQSAAEGEKKRKQLMAARSGVKADATIRGSRRVSSRNDAGLGL
eukprot:TRINITY_DN16366_c0_g1_i1.p1 TRINITY_DN16366_c0_g1~~TRINITY_DN16366_c0_g1_i1.p1  ORF type:complete len:352 (+),score=99.45 TRINITY_DN16366_c0_g1_i1:110-1165(+)